jgi:choline dehydrogenase-like flavoprotein
VENLIVGSGLAGIATGMALRGRQLPFQVVDVGYDLDPTTEQCVAELGSRDPARWDGQLRERLFPSPVASAAGVERRLVFGSDFPYRVPDALSVRMEGCVTELTHALGGFGNVWGAAMLPYTARTLRSWPISRAELYQSYRNVLQYVPLSAERDALQEAFPLYTDHATPLDRCAQTDALLKALDRRKERLSRAGIAFGRARTAVDSTSGSLGCRYCGHCLDGCVYGSIYSPRSHWRRLAWSEHPIHKGFYVLEFEEHEDRVLVLAVGTQDGSRRVWSTRRLFLAAGHLATARIIARSLRRLNEPIRVRESQYFFFPLLSYGSRCEERRFSLVDIFLEILNDAMSRHHMHFQVYAMNSLFKRTLRTLIPAPLPIKAVTDRFFLFQGFLHSDDSGHLELSLLSAGDKGDEVLIRGVEYPRALAVARRAKAFLKQSLIGLGIIPPLFLRLVPPGRSFHAGGSFPMGGTHPLYASDALGRPAGLKRVHIVDSANFPDIPSSTIGFTIMANADRIANSSAL